MSGLLHALLPLAPLLLLLVSLLLGRYPGCDAIVRISERFASGSRLTSTTSSMRRPADRRRAAIAGGLLIAFGLARRPPPLTA